jgi:hypothetical protein
MTSAVLGAVTIKNARERLDRLGDPLAFGAGETIKQERIRGRPLERHGFGCSLATGCQPHVGLPTVVRSSTAQNVSAPLEPAQIPARGRRVDAQHVSQRRGRHRAALGNELQRFGLLRCHLAGSRSFSSEPTERSGEHLERACGLEVAHTEPPRIVKVAAGVKPRRLTQASGTA